LHELFLEELLDGVEQLHPVSLGASLIGKLAKLTQDLTAARNNARSPAFGRKADERTSGQVSAAS
jgi:hypothetical protein